MLSRKSSLLHKANLQDAAKGSSSTLGRGVNWQTNASRASFIHDCAHASLASLTVIWKK